ncbi:RNA polymerase factor sigma C [Alteribacter lacisalsi]|uniref:RNA polymerase factor sigma C n=2 Tax=Alteribacter lacisalsi TaxID=2045244 RepID=A0A2W0HBA0_9BACI|nr:RNA polymerase factor sigma C [Alteribacter lacisalsi]
MDEHNKEDIVDHLIDVYGDRILHMAYTYVKNEATAEDLTQDVFIKCYEKLDQFHGRSSLKTWLYCVAANHFRDYLKSWHHRKVSLNEKVLSYFPSQNRNVEETVVARDDEQQLSEAVMALPVKYREVVFLHYYEELPLADVSRMTGVNTNTLKTRLTRARQLLKEMISEEEK